MTNEAPSEATGYWAAAAEGRLVVKHCQDCGRAHHYPRSLCPHCLSAATEYRPSSGRGTVYSLTRTRTETREQVLAFVTLVEGPTILTELVQCEGQSLEIGSAVIVSFAERDGKAVPVFMTTREST